MGPLVAAERDQQEADDADDRQAGIPVHGHLAAIGPPPSGGGCALHPFASRIARHDRTTPYSLGSGTPVRPVQPLVRRDRQARAARAPIPTTTSGSRAVRQPSEVRTANRTRERWCSKIIRYG